VTEGQTEQNFVRRVLASHLGSYGVYTDARCVLTSRDRRSGKVYRGGLISYEKAKKDILSWIAEDGSADCRFTTMFDLYALPEDFPRYGDAAKVSDPYGKIDFLEAALASSVADSRFIPYIQLHEFEALVLSDPGKLAGEYLDRRREIDRLVSLAEGRNPELIDDGVETAPSKRILKEIPEYDKVAVGVSVVERIGLGTLRSRCRHFSDWVQRLESLSVPSR
jgi:hypothetical protein